MPDVSNVSADLKVISTFPFSAEARATLREAAGKDVLCITNTDELLSRLREAEVLCSYWIPNDWRILAPRLRWLQYSSGGVDELLPTGILDADSGVIVTTAAGIYANTISEYVFGSMLMFNRTWPEMIRLQDRHVWPRSAHWYNLGGRELGDQTLGIIGLGNIGRRIAQLGKAFGMHVLATRRTLPSHSQQADDPDVDQYYPLERLHEMLHEVRLRCALCAPHEGNGTSHRRGRIACDAPPCLLDQRSAWADCGRTGIDPRIAVRLDRRRWPRRCRERTIGRHQPALHVAKCHSDAAYLRLERPLR